MAATLHVTQKGVALQEPAQMTFSMTRTAGGWKIARWSWTGPDPTPTK